MPDFCTPRARYTERMQAGEAAAREAHEAAEEKRWHDSLTEMERWFYRLPNRDIEEICWCGSGKPVVYWSPDDGSGCESCRGSLFVYIPHAVMWNIMRKFGIPQDIQTAILDAINEEEKRYHAPE